MNLFNNSILHLKSKYSFNFPTSHYVWFALTLFFFVSLEAKQVENLRLESIAERASRFWSMEDHSVQIVTLGSILMGISCGMIGSFVVTRRLSMFGDTLSHAVLPGIAVGFLWSQTKDNLSLLIGATVAGFLGVSCLRLLKKFTNLKEDSSLGIVLSAFYAIGICLLTRIQKMEFGNQSGLDSFLFGQASSLAIEDVWTIGCTLGLTAIFIWIFFEELLITGFDSSFARSVGIKDELLNYVLWVLIAFCIITSLQIVGVILASALLIIPAVSASLIAIQMKRYLFWSAIFGAISGVCGTFISFLGKGIPTGPLIVLSSSLLFLIVLLFRPKKGAFFQWNHSRRSSIRIQMENTLKAIYQVLEQKNFQKNSITSIELMHRRGIGREDCEREIKLLIRSELASQRELSSTETLPGLSEITLTPEGWEYACKIVRNHRLWELYLTNEAEYDDDHVHEDAEKIEHLLGEKTIRHLERILSNPRTDPHGKLIPSICDMENGWIEKDGSISQSK